MGFTNEQSYRASAAPEPLSLDRTTSSALENRLCFARSLLDKVQLASGAIEIVRGIDQAFPEIIASNAGAPATPHNLVQLALRALEAAGLHGHPSDWIHVLNADLHFFTGIEKEQSLEVLSEFTEGIHIGTETSFLWEISLEEMSPGEQIAFTLLGWLSSDQDFEPLYSPQFEEEDYVNLAVAVSQSGLIFRDEHTFTWPEESAHWRAMAFFDASSGNPIVDIRNGMATLDWKDLVHGVEHMQDAERYLLPALDYLDTVMGQDTVVGIIAWAGHLIRDRKMFGSESE
jgi:hypothetical protein